MWTRILAGYPSVISRCIFISQLCSFYHIWPFLPIQTLDSLKIFSKYIFFWLVGWFLCLYYCMHTLYIWQINYIVWKSPQWKILVLSLEISHLKQCKTLFYCFLNTSAEENCSVSLVCMIQFLIICNYIFFPMNIFPPLSFTKFMFPKVLGKEDPDILWKHWYDSHPFHLSNHSTQQFRIGRLLK